MAKGIMNSRNVMLAGTIETGGGGAVNSVNGQTGDVVLDAEDVGAVSDDVIYFEAGVVGIIGSTIKIGGGDDNVPYIANVGYTGNFTIDPNPNNTTQLVTKGYVDGLVGTVKTTMDSVAVANTKYFLGTQTSVSITMPTTVSIGQEILIVFSSGATACTLTCDLQGFDFVPKANKTSWLKFTYCSTNNWLVETKEG